MTAGHQVMFAKLIATWLVTDFISGLFHWLEDSYGHPRLPIVGRYVTKPDLLHHHQPRKFVTNSWWSSADVLLLTCLVALLVAYAIGRLSPMVFLSAALGVNANQIHKWCHRTRRENGRIVVALQRLRLVQSPRQHSRHHAGRRDTSYCILTDFLNPILDTCRFWRALESLVYAVFGIRKRDDDALLARLLEEDPSFLDDESGLKTWQRPGRIAIAVLLMLAAAPSARAQAVATTFQELQGRLAVGEAVVVTSGAGETVRGRVQQVSETSLLVRSGSRDRDLAAGDVQRIAYPSHAIRNWMLVGLAAGFTTGAIVAGTSGCGVVCFSKPSGVLLFGGIGGAIGIGSGAAIGAATGREHVVFERAGGPRAAVVSFLGGQGAGLRFSLAF